MRTTSRLMVIAGLTLGVACGIAFASEGNIDADARFAWAENAGWTSFLPLHGGVTVYATHLAGYAWSESVGWIKLGADDATLPGARGPYANTSATNWGVNRDGAGVLSGLAWAENAGW